MTTGTGAEDSDAIVPTVDAKSLLPVVARIAEAAAGPVELSLSLHQDAEFVALRQRLKFELDSALNLELEEDGRVLGSVALVEGAHYMTAIRPLAEAPVETIELWRELFRLTEDPLLRAHLADVLLTSRAESGQSHAAATAEAYVVLAQRPGIERYYASLALARAVTIARMRALPIEATIRNEVAAAAERALDAGEPLGVVMRLLDAIAAKPRSYSEDADERSRVTSLLDRAEQTFTTPPGADSVAAARREHANTPAERVSANRSHVSAYLSSAMAEDSGFRKMHWAQEAAELAQRYELRDLHDDAIRIMQSIREEDMEWQVLELDVPPVPKAAFRVHMRRYRSARDWRTALTIFVGSKAPGGSHDRNIQTAKGAAKGSIRALVSRTTFGAHGLPERSKQDFDDEELVRTESFALATSGLLLAMELQEIARRFGPLDGDKVAEWLRSNFGASAELASEFGTALERFQEGRYSDSARISIPLIEAGARGLLLTLDEAIYRLERGASPGRFPALDFYVEKLETLGLDPDWVRSIRTMLLSPGNNNRNLAAHGFKWNFSDTEAAVLLRLASLFCVMPLAQPDRIDLSRPTLQATHRLKRRIGWVWGV